MNHQTKTRWQLKQEIELWQTSDNRLLCDRAGSLVLNRMVLDQREAKLDDQDLASAYINWSSYSATDGRAAPEALRSVYGRCKLYCTIRTIVSTTCWTLMTTTNLAV